MCIFALVARRMVGIRADCNGFPVEALRDLDYITTCAQRGEMNDPIMLTTKKTLLRRLVEDMAESFAAGTDVWEPSVERLREDMEMIYSRTLADPLDGNNVLRFGSTRSARNKGAMLKGYLERHLERLAMAILGGVFLVASMLIMVLHPSLVTSLVTSCVFVFAFSVIISHSPEMPFDVLSATVAYAAVLVVFVGTSTSSSAGPAAVSG